MPLPFAILPTDARFPDSPEEGSPWCLCSRCLGVILECCAPAIRAWPADGRYEYRYHPHCLGAEPCCHEDEYDRGDLDED